MRFLLLWPAALLLLTATAPAKAGVNQRSELQKAQDDLKVLNEQNKVLESKIVKAKFEVLQLKALKPKEKCKRGDFDHLDYWG